MRTPTRYTDIIIRATMPPIVLEEAKRYLQDTAQRLPFMPEAKALELDDNDTLTLCVGQYSVQYVLLLCCPKQHLLTDKVVRTISGQMVKLVALACAHATGGTRYGSSHIRYAAEVLLGELRRYERDNTTEQTL